MGARSSVALLAALALAAAGCGGSSSEGGPGETGNGAPGKGKKGGKVTFLAAADVDYLDPGQTYYTFGYAVAYATQRPLYSFKPDDAETPVPDLAEGEPQISEDNKTITVKIRSGVKYSPPVNREVTTKDIKYGIERSFAAELSGGAPFLRDWLIGGATYQGPYKDKKGLDSVETPDDQTIVFRLNKPVGDFDYVATQTSFAPVPKAKDKGTKYEEHPVSTGPYKVVKNSGDGERLQLERNPHWSAETDAERKAYPDKIDVRSGLNSSVINQRLSASQGADAAAITTDTNLGPAELAKVSGDKKLAAQVGTGHFGYTNYLAFNPKVKPFDDPKVRQAIAYAVDRTSVINAAGGSSLAEPATTFLPNQESFGYTKFDHFPAGASGNAKKAKELLKEAGHKDGLTITLTHSNDKNFETSPEIATALQDALKKAGGKPQPSAADRRRVLKVLQQIERAMTDVSFLAGRPPEMMAAGPYQDGDATVIGHLVGRRLGRSPGRFPRGPSRSRLGSRRSHRR